MSNCTTSIVALCAGVLPLMASITPDDTENWLKIGGLAALVFIQSVQLAKCHKRENELHEQANELRRQLIEAINKCSKCSLAQAANQELIDNHHEK